ncbi:hypothetical protein ATJ97_1567 [Georgenia soli]|uniref:Probable membrane transporter protein n=1 Tax=Georgenia soli TaxID=638953 RepID=A0A2A9ELC9_9MICO|nr:sulfite exporter TauE/SafE family protein [Georgenia soli]PFG39072.1 hypothetical protein ATJ97_1567 [Georgenia soli]
MNAGLLALVLAAVILGCVLQRTSGMGTGLVVAPALALAIGPVTGVMLTNATTIMSALLLTLAARAEIDWRRYAVVAPVVVLGAVPAALLVREADTGVLEVIIGVVVLTGLGGAVLWRGMPVVGGRVPGLAAGVVGGFLNTAVGVAAPAMLIYARATGWEQRPFAATLQPIFLTMGTVSLVTKLGVGAAGPAGPPDGWLVAAVACAVPVGVLLGGRVARRVSAGAARRLAVVVVSVGAMGTLVRGVARLVTTT